MTELRVEEYTNPGGSSHRDQDFEVWARGNYPAATMMLYFEASLDLRRAALFLWITPLEQTRSSVLSASCIAGSAVA